MQSAMEIFNYNCLNMLVGYFLVHLQSIIPTSRYSLPDRDRRGFHCMRGIFDEVRAEPREGEQAPEPSPRL